jgi:nucleoside-diphosphate-sugar epimerase
MVTGGAGFIGSTLAEALLARGDAVRVVDDFSSGRRQNIEALRALPGGDRLEVFEGSITDEALVRRAMQGVDVVFHHAAIPSVVLSVEKPQATMFANVQGTTVVLDVARACGVRRVVFAASAAAYGNATEVPTPETAPLSPLSPYAVSKVSGELLMKAFADLYGMETVSLRYFNVFGARQDPKSQYAAAIPNFISAALRGEAATVFGDGEQTRDFCHVDNVVRANLLAAASPKKLAGQIVNIACGERVSLNVLLRIIAEATGTKVPPKYDAPRPGDVRDSLATIDAARELLGYEPTVLIREGLERTIRALQGAGGAGGAAGARS